MAKVQYKIYQARQTLTADPVFYGLVLNKSLGPVDSLRQIMAEKKITAFEPSQLSTLIDSVLQGAMELTARDGIPRSIGSNLRTHLAWDRGLSGLNADPKSVPMSVRMRLLKDLRVPVDMGNLEFTNDAPATLPKVSRVFATGTEEGSSGTISLSYGVTVLGDFLNGDAASGLEFADATLMAPDAGPTDIPLAQFETTDPASFYRLPLRWVGEPSASLAGQSARVQLHYSFTDGRNIYINAPVKIVA